jgi:outer membrane receptor protein involved in Fe transport
MRVISCFVLYFLFNVDAIAQIPDVQKLKDSIIKPQLNADTLLNKISLQDIVIKGKKPTVSFKLDRQVFRAAEYLNGNNGTAVDLIKNLPSISVNGQGEINVRGSSSIQVLLNGKPTQGDPVFILGQLSAASIESVEFISSPGASFDAEGKSGILNIITKNAPEGGLIIYSNIMMGAPPINDFNNERYDNPKRFSADVSLGYQKNKWDISSGFNYIRNDIAGYREGDVYTISPPFKTSFPSEGERSFKRYSFGGRFSAGYQLNEKNKLDAALYIGEKYQSRVADLIYNNSRMDLLIRNTISRFQYFNENTAEKEGVFNLASVGSSHQINNQLSFSQSFQYEGALLESLTSNFNYADRSKSFLYQETSNPGRNPLNAFRWKADLKGGESILWQTGIQLRHDIQKGSFNYLSRTASNQSFVTDPFFSGAINVENNIQAGYFQFSRQFTKWYTQGGIRAEYMLRQVRIGSTDPNKLSLFNLFPSYLMRYQQSPKTVFKHSFTRRIKRTNNFELNPLPEREHSETLEQGDANLLPELTGIWELGLEQKLNKGNLALSFYHQRVKNPIQRVNNVFNDTILGRLFTNAGLATQTGIEIGLNYRIGRIWQLIVGGNTYKYNIRGQLFNGLLDIENSSWVYSINTANTFNLKNNWSVQLSMNYLSVRATAQGEDGAFFTPNLAVRKVSKDTRWNFQLQWLYMDAGLGISNIQRITTKGKYFYTTTNYIFEPDQLQFSFGFNISRKNRKISLPESEMAEKEF